MSGDPGFWGPASAWVLIGLVALVTALIKGVGPVLLGGRDLPPRVTGVIVLLPAVLLTALVLTSAFADGQRLVLDPRAAGVAVAGLLLWRRAPVIVAVVAAAAVTALVRLVT